MNLTSMLTEAVRRYGGKTAIVSGESRLSYVELDKASNKVANALLKMGVNKGDRVAILLPNSPEFVITYFGIVKIGAIAVLLDIYYKTAEMDAFFADSLPRVLVAESSTLERLTPVLPGFKSLRHIISLDSECPGQFHSYQEIMARSSAQEIEAEPEPEDITHIAYSSGPAFPPRGVIVSHRHLVQEAAISGDGFQQTDKDIMMLYALPMHHMFGLVAGLLASLRKGSTVVIVPGTGLSLSSFMATVEKEKGTMFLAVPYIFALALEMAEKEGIKSDLSSLRLCGSAGAPLPVDVVLRFKQRYGFDIVDFWGLTEATCHVTCPPLDGRGKLGSVGRALPGWEVKIVDDNGRELPLNQSGEIIVRGPIMKGYYHQPQATAAVIRDGWLYTGDLGRIDADGYLFITGRKKPIIIVKGQNIYPRDVETVLSGHPKVAEVKAMGIPDRLRGEIVGAIVRLKAGESATEQEIKQFCLERMADYKAPKQVIFANALPRTVTSPIRR